MTANASSPIEACGGGNDGVVGMRGNKDFFSTEAVAQLSAMILGRATLKRYGGQALGLGRGSELRTGLTP